MYTLKRIALVMTLIVTLGLSVGCAKRQSGVEIITTDEVIITETYPTFSALDEASQTITDGIIYFAFDKYDIKPEYQLVLKEKADIMKQYPNIRVRIEGNCDTRGTQEYNLALGERRARAAYEYMIMLGVNPSQLEMISFGKERPAVSGIGPESWSKNRRDDFRVIAR